MDRDRNDWSAWGTRIISEESDELMKHCQFLKDKGLIPKVDKYSVTRFALRSLLNTLKKNNVSENLLTNDIN